MGKKHKTVPAALHSELTEYSNLLRVLRTQETLDITAHLAPSAASSDHKLSFDDNAHHDAFDDDSGEYNIPQLDATSAEHGGMNGSRTEQGISPPATATLSASGKGKARVAFAVAPGAEKSRVRDTWTRWPLLAGDVHVPEWGFADEVYLLARQALDRIPTSNSTPSTSASAVHKREDAADAEEDEENIEEDGSELDSDADSQISPAANGALSSLCEAHLGQILAALASHVPLAQSSMQNRIRPLGWVDVLDIVSVSGLVDDVVIGNVQERMEAVYGPAGHSLAHRTRVLNSTPTRAMSAPDLSFLSFPGFDNPDPFLLPRKRKHEPVERRTSIRIRARDRARGRGAPSSAQSSSSEPLVARIGQKDTSAADQHAKHDKQKTHRHRHKKEKRDQDVDYGGAEGDSALRRSTRLRSAAQG